MQFFTNNLCEFFMETRENKINQAKFQNRIRANKPQELTVLSPDEIENLLIGQKLIKLLVKLAMMIIQNSKKIVKEIDSTNCQECPKVRLCLTQEKCLFKDSKIALQKWNKRMKKEKSKI